MSIEIGLDSDPLAVLSSQVKFIAEQENSGIEAKYMKVRCGCLKIIKWSYAYRCLYCVIFYCRECAEDHFGQTVQDYRNKPPAETE